MSIVRAKPENLPLAEALRLPCDQPSLYWLGQAGFALQHNDALILIDPYLSNALAIKYEGTALPHKRMMRAPIRVEDLPRVDAVLITHRHGDHLDNIALPQILDRWPQCRIILPKAEIHTAMDLGLPESLLNPINAGESLTIGAMDVHALAAAHETLQCDTEGNHHFLGYVLNIDDFCIYHSGDSIPFDRLDNMLAPFNISLALLPVNGRDERRANMNVPGNFTLEEAITLCTTHSIPAMIGQHFEMFAFNTIERQQIEDAAIPLADSLDLFAATLRTKYVLVREKETLQK